MIEIDEITKKPLKNKENEKKNIKYIDISNVSMKPIRAEEAIDEIEE